MVKLNVFSKYECYLISDSAAECERVCGLLLTACEDSDIALKEYDPGKSIEVSRDLYKKRFICEEPLRIDYALTYTAAIIKGVVSKADNPPNYNFVRSFIVKLYVISKYECFLISDSVAECERVYRLILAACEDKDIALFAYATGKSKDHRDLYKKSFICEKPLLIENALTYFAVIIKGIASKANSNPSNQEQALSYPESFTDESDESSSLKRKRITLTGNFFNKLVKSTGDDILSIASDSTYHYYK